QKVEELKEQARAELAKLDAMGGAVAGIDYMKESLIASNAARVADIERGDQVLVGVNAYTETEPSPLDSGVEGILTVPESVELEQIAALQAWRQNRDNAVVNQALADLKEAAVEGRNIMPPSIAAAKAGVTTGEWGTVLREVFGEYRAPTGIGATHEVDDARMSEIRDLVSQVSGKLGRTLTFVVGKPGLDGHSNGAEQIAVRADDVGMKVVYDGIRLTPAEIVSQAKEAKAHVVGLSILSGSHVSLVRDVVQKLREAGMSDVPVVVGGIIPQEDVNILKQCGASAVYTPKDFQLNEIMTGIVGLVNDNVDALAKAG
ncbi:MAG: methylmalonyl-CoA mutase family protein, partial [Methyloceanibacter sp.]